MNQPRQEGEIHRADPAYRRQMWAWFAFAVVVGAIALFALQYWLAAMRASSGADGGLAFGHWLHRLLAVLCALVGIAAVALGAWLRRVAEATRRDRRWPPNAMRTSSDVRVRYLTAADALVTQFRVAGLVLFVAAAGFLAWAVWLLRSGG
jgi:hypothetical protein